MEYFRGNCSILQMICLSFVFCRTDTRDYGVFRFYGTLFDRLCGICSIIDRILLQLEQCTGPLRKILLAEGTKIDTGAITSRPLVETIVCLFCNQNTDNSYHAKI